MPKTYPTIVITGASGGLGAAIAICFAHPDVTLCLVGRDSAGLLAVADECRNKGATVEIAVANGCDAISVGHMVTKFDDRHPVDLLIVAENEASTLGPDMTPEPDGTARRLMDINYGGMLNAVEPLLPSFIARGRGRIALVSSVVALRPQPMMPAYSASMMAVRGYGVALRGWLRRYGVGVTVIYAGLPSEGDAAEPPETTVERTASRIVHGLRRGRATIAFPFWPALGS